MEDQLRTTHYVRPLNFHKKNAYPLEYYMMSPKKFDKSFTTLQFLPGIHNLNYDLVLHNVENFTMSGNNSIIQCNGLPVLIGAVNVTNLIIKNLDLINCGKRHDVFNNKTHYYIGVIYLYNCTAVMMNSVSIIANPNVVGIVASNLYTLKVSSFTRVTIAVKCDGTALVNGI